MHALFDHRRCQRLQFRLLAEEVTMTTQRKIAVLGCVGFVLCSSITALAVCENVTNTTQITMIGRFRTLTGADNGWENNLFDGNSGEPTFPSNQQIGFLDSGGTWNVGSLATIQDSSGGDCDDVQILNYVSWYAVSSTCSGT